MTRTCTHYPQLKQPGVCICFGIVRPGYRSESVNCSDFPGEWATGAGGKVEGVEGVKERYQHINRDRYVRGPAVFFFKSTHHSINLPTLKFSLACSFFNGRFISMIFGRHLKHRLGFLASKDLEPCLMSAFGDCSFVIVLTGGREARVCACISNPPPWALSKLQDIRRLSLVSK